MKRFLLVLFALPLLFTACENVLSTEGADIAMLTESKLNTEPILYEGKVVDTDYFVSATALNAYLALQPNRAERSKRSVASIEPTGPNSDVTLMYVVNYEGGGWEIISADKRTEPILAYSDCGSFSWEKANPGEIAWMGGVGEGLLHLRTAGPDAKLTEKATKEKEQNVNFWDGLEMTKAFIDKNGKDALNNAVEVSHEEISQILANQQTRVNSEGYYRLAGSVQTEVATDSLRHLMVTRWGQFYHNYELV
ncbi:MAG: Spi family protease inhibitor [Tidjanibacter sp.]|nr:Spi family protease inhibitor [Tidjanibacter sp.]